MLFYGIAVVIGVLCAIVIEDRFTSIGATIILCAIWGILYHG